MDEYELQKYRRRTKWQWFVGRSVQRSAHPFKLFVESKTRSRGESRCHEAPREIGRAACEGHFVTRLPRRLAQVQKIRRRWKISVVPKVIFCGFTTVPIDTYFRAGEEKKKKKRGGVTSYATAVPRRLITRSIREFNVVITAATLLIFYC